MDDRQIIDGFFRRDESAITELAQKYGGYCFSIANNILEQDEDAEECVSDTWLKTWNAIPPEKPDHLRLFLAKITRNLALNRWNAQNRQKRGGGAVTVALEEIGEFLPSSDRAETRAEEAAFMQSVSRFLRTLSRRDSGIFIRRYFYVESAKVIAGKYGMNEGTVQKLLFRTRTKLKHHLESEGYTL